jgi:outer membrane receptor protein involved in Fe transport
LVATRLHTLYLERARRTIDWEANFRLRWTYNAFSASTNVHWINVFKDCMQNSCTIQEEGAPQPPSRQVPGHYAMDANVAYNWELLAGTATVQLGVDNLFDEMPAYVGNGSKAISDLTVYDFMDRYFYMRLSYSYD